MGNTGLYYTAGSLSSGRGSKSLKPSPEDLEPGSDSPGSFLCPLGPPYYIYLGPNRSALIQRRAPDGARDPAWINNGGSRIPKGTRLPNYVAQGSKELPNSQRGEQQHQYGYQKAHTSTPSSRPVLVSWAPEVMLAT
jgi:hypothetical protein